MYIIPIFMTHNEWKYTKKSAYNLVNRAVIMKFISVLYSNVHHIHIVLLLDTKEGKKFIFTNVITIAAIIIGLSHNWRLTHVEIQWSFSFYLCRALNLCKKSLGIKLNFLYDAFLKAFKFNLKKIKLWEPFSSLTC